MQVVPSYASVSGTALGMPVEQTASLFPNPTQGPFTLRMPVDADYSAGEVRIMDTMGNVVRTFSVRGLYNDFNLSGLARGIYFVEVYKNARFLQSFRVSYE